MPGKRTKWELPIGKRGGHKEKKGKLDNEVKKGVRKS